MIREHVVPRRGAGAARAPSRAAATLQALGLVLPVLGAVGLALSLWIYDVPRFQDLRELRGEVARVEFVKPRRGASFALVTLGEGEVLHVRWVRTVKGAEDGLRGLRTGEMVTTWIAPHELERPHHHLAWQLARGREPIFEFADMVAPLERERGRFRIFCGVVLTVGLIGLLAGRALRLRG